MFIKNNNCLFNQICADLLDPKNYKKDFLFKYNQITHYIKIHIGQPYILHAFYLCFYEEKKSTKN